MIKDVYELKQLALTEEEDVTFYASQHCKTPSPQNFLWRGQANQEIKLQDFETAHVYCALYSMSGIAMRVAFGFQKDPYGNNAGLMQKCNDTSQAKQAVLINSKIALRQKEEEKNQAIEEALFSKEPEKSTNPGRFRK